MVALTFEPALQRISEQARPYPAHLLPEGGTALCLFSAAFLGWNDAIHMARKRMVTTCVDIDEERLLEMSGIYPPAWTFRAVDAWNFALDAVEDHQTWDAVSVDTFTGSPEKRSMHSLSLWCAIANSVVTVTRSKGHRYAGLVPSGWNASCYERSSEVDWLVLTRA